jgi:acyl carrier protein
MMTTTDVVLRRARQIAADIFDLPLDAITAGSCPQTIATWDSLHHINLVLALEQSFDVQFLPEEIVEMLTIERIVVLIEQKLSAAVAP